MICIGIQYTARDIFHIHVIWGSPTSLSSQPTLQITSHERLRSSIPTVSNMIVKKLTIVPKPPAHSTALVPSTLAPTGCLPYFFIPYRNWRSLTRTLWRRKSRHKKKNLKKKEKRAQVEKTAKIKSKSEDSHKKEKSAAYQLKNWVWLSTMKGEKRPTIWRMII